MTSLKPDILRVAYIAKHTQLLSLIMSLQRSVHHEVVNHCGEHHRRLQQVNMNPGLWRARTMREGRRTNLDITSSRSDLGISARCGRLGEQRFDAVCRATQEQLLEDGG